VAGGLLAAARALASSRANLFQPFCDRIPAVVAAKLGDRVGEQMRTLGTPASGIGCNRWC
jgi:hypothetical protein